MAASSELHLLDRSGVLQPHWCTDPLTFRLRSDESWFGAVELLNREFHVRTKGAFSKLEQSLGLNHCPNGLMAHPELGLRPISGCLYDWMHCYVVNGVMQVELSLLLASLASAGIRLQMIHAFLVSFTHPEAVKSATDTVCKLFDGRKKQVDIKPAASESLTLYPLLRMFLLHCLNGEIAWRRAEAAERCMKSFLALASVLDILMQVNKAVPVDGEVLTNAILHHLNLFKVAYGVEPMTPKFHFCVHLGWLLTRHSCLVACFVHERKHRRPS